MEHDPVYKTWLHRSYSGKLRFIKREDGLYKMDETDKKPVADVPVYVNVRNERRFFRNTPIKDALAKGDRDGAIHQTVSLRVQKALHLYHLIREYHLFEWWD